MAKEILENNIDKPLTSIVTDSSYEDQPKGSSSFILNGVSESNEGDKYKIITELSNDICGEITSGYLPIGRTYTNDGRTVIFRSESVV